MATDVAKLILSQRGLWHGTLRCIMPGRPQDPLRETLQKQ